MDGTIRSAYAAALEELTAIEERHGLYFYPIRHHSLACSQHLKHLLDKFQPQMILMGRLMRVKVIIPAIIHCSIIHLSLLL